MRLLVLDHKVDQDSWGSHDLTRACFEAAASLGMGASLEIQVRRPPQGDLPTDSSRFDALVLSGSRTSCLDSSPWVKDTLTFIERWLKTSRPTLGVCYGHQLMARVLSGDSAVGKSASPEYGWTQLKQQAAPTRLLENLPPSFYSYSSHQEEVKKLPDGFLATLKSEACAIQAMEHQDEAWYGIQFHPEKSLVEAQTSLSQVRKFPRLNERRAKDVFDPKVGSLVFGNFLKRVTAR